MSSEAGESSISNPGRRKARTTTKTTKALDATNQRLFDNMRGRFDSAYAAYRDKSRDSVVYLQSDTAKEQLGTSRSESDWDVNRNHLISEIRKLDNVVETYKTTFEKHLSDFIRYVSAKNRRMIKGTLNLLEEDI